MGLSRRAFGLGLKGLARVGGEEFALGAARASLHSGYRVFGGRVDGAIRSLAEGVPTDLTRQRRYAVVRNGISLELDLDDNAQRVLFLTGTYERAFTRWLRTSLRRGDVYMDVGAHIGIHALAAAKRLQELGGGQVIAVEPTTDSAARLEAAVCANALQNVTVVRTALGETPGTLRLFGDDRYSARDAGVRSAFNSGVLVAEVPLTPLDDLVAHLGLDRVDVVKIDVEGSEIGVVRGMSETVRRFAPRFICVEVEDFRLEQAGSSQAELNELLAALGYRPTGRDLLTNRVYGRAA